MNRNAARKGKPGESKECVFTQVNQILCRGIFKRRQWKIIILRCFFWICPYKMFNNSGGKKKKKRLELFWYSCGLDCNAWMFESFLKNKKVLCEKEIIECKLLAMFSSFIFSSDNISLQFFNTVLERENSWQFIYRCREDSFFSLLYTFWKKHIEKNANIFFYAKLHDWDQQAWSFCMSC